MSTFKDIHLYYGMMAQAIEGLKVYNGCIGPEVLQKLKDHPESISVKPYLIPLEAAVNDVNLQIRMKERAKGVPYENMHASLSAILDVAKMLRMAGYDCDSLIDQGLAICHASYDAKSLL